MRSHPLFSTLLPAPCLFCACGRADDGVCAECRAELPGRDAGRCPVCAIASPLAAVCGECLRAPPAFDRSVVAASYAFPLDAAIARLKYGKDLTLTAALGGLLHAAVRAEPLPDLLLPMPLSAARLRQRGFNQAAELARVVAARMALPLRADLARRTRDAVPQAALPLDQRHANVREAFACDGDLDGARVAVVDDVMTTGASLGALAQALRRAGAAQVVCWVLARTERPD
jgi:ComF family protein